MSGTNNGNSTKVFWTEIEERLLGDKMFERWKKRPLDSLTQTYEYVQQHDWPEHRRRKIAGMSQAKTARKRLDELIKNILAKVDNAETAGPVDNTEMLKLLEHVTVKEPVPYDPVTFMKAQPTMVLVQELLHRFTSPQTRTLEILEGLEQKLAEPKQQQPRYAPVPPPVPLPATVAKKQKLYIGIAGCFTDEFGLIKQQVGDKADLVLLDPQHSHHTIPPALDYLVWNTKFANHADFEKAKGTLGKRVLLVTGGRTTITQKVYDVLSMQ